MTIALILAEDIPNIAKTGDIVVLKDDNTFEIQKMNPEKDTKREEIAQFPGQKRISEKEDEKVSKEFAGYTDFADCVSKNKDKGDPEAYCGSIKHKVEDTKKAYDPRIEKYLPNDQVKAWEILSKFYKTNKYFDANAVLKEFINKIATCPEVSDKFEKIMEDWMRDGEADISGIEKVITACKAEGGNVVVKSEDNPTSEEKDQAHKIAREKALTHETEVAHETARKLAVSHAKNVTKEVLDEIEKTNPNEKLKTPTFPKTKEYLKERGLLKDNLGKSIEEITKKKKVSHSSGYGSNKFEKDVTKEVLDEVTKDMPAFNRRHLNITRPNLDEEKRIKDNVKDYKDKKAKEDVKLF